MNICDFPPEILGLIFSNISVYSLDTSLALVCKYFWNISKYSREKSPDKKAAKRIQKWWRIFHGHVKPSNYMKLKKCLYNKNIDIPPLIKEENGIKRWVGCPSCYGLPEVNYKLHQWATSGRFYIPRYGDILKFIRVQSTYPIRKFSLKTNIDSPPFIEVNLYSKNFVIFPTEGGLPVCLICFSALYYQIEPHIPPTENDKIRVFIRVAYITSEEGRKELKENKNKTIELKSRYVPQNGRIYFRNGFLSMDDHTA